MVSIIRGITIDLAKAVEIAIPSDVTRSEVGSMGSDFGKGYFMDVVRFGVEIEVLGFVYFADYMGFS